MWGSVLTRPSNSITRGSSTEERVCVCILAQTGLCFTFAPFVSVLVSEPFSHCAAFISRLHIKCQRLLLAGWCVWWYLATWRWRWACTNLPPWHVSLVPLPHSVNCWKMDDTGAKKEKYIFKMFSSRTMSVCVCASEFVCLNNISSRCKLSPSLTFASCLTHSSSFLLLLSSLLFFLGWWLLTHSLKTLHSKGWRLIAFL